MTNEHDDGSGLGEALELAMSTVGVDPLSEPRRATGVVADLVGTPGADRSEIGALRAVLVALAAPHDRERVRASVVDAASNAGVARGEAARVLREIEGPLGVAFSGEGRVPLLQRTETKVAAVVLATVVIAALVISRLWPDDDDGNVAVDDTSNGEDVSSDEQSPDPDDDAGTTSTTTSTTTTTEALSDGLTAVIPDVIEDQLRVQRAWRVTPGSVELIGEIWLSSATGDPVTQIFTDLALPSAVTSAETVVWTPPSLRDDDITGVFNIRVSGDEIVKVEYRVPLERDIELTSTELLEWINEWRVEIEGMRFFPEPIGDPAVSAGP